MSAGKARELTRRLVERQREESGGVMRAARLRRKEERCVRRVEAYIQTFVQELRIARWIRELGRGEKAALYGALRAEAAGEAGREESLEGFFRLAVERLEGQAVHFQQAYPHKQRAISRWKNHRLHQLSSAHSFIAQEQHSSCDLHSELALLDEEKFFPELRQEAEELRCSISSHLREQ